MKLWSTLSVTCLIVVASFTANVRSAEAKVPEKLLGKWEASDGEIKGSIFEFVKNGDLKLNIKLSETKLDLTGKFKVLSEDSLEMTIKGPDGKETTEKLTFKFDKEVLSITGPDNKTFKFDKAK